MPELPTSALDIHALSTQDQVEFVRSDSFEAEGFDRMRQSLSKILIVDDAPEFCESLAWLLNDEGYQCRVAGNGQHAIDLLE